MINKKNLWKSIPNDIYVIAGYILIAIIFQWRNVFTDTLIGGFSGDTPSISYSLISFYSEAIKKGEFPFWLPYIYSGMPYFGVFGTLYPLNWIVGVFDPMIGFKISYIINGVLGAFFMYKYTKSFKLHNAACFIAGFLFGFLGAVVIRYGHLGVAQTIIWLPLILLFFNKWYETLNIKYIAFVAIASFLCYTAGFIQVFIYIYIIVSLYMLYKLFLLKVNRIKFLLGCICSIFLVVLLVSIQFLSSYELSKYGVRNIDASMPFQSFTSYSYNPAFLLTGYFPWILSGIDGNSFIPSYSAVEMAFYVGILPIFFAIASVFKFFKKYIEVKLHTLIFIVSLIMAMGKFTPLSKLLYHIPIYHNFGVQSRWHFMLSFSVIVLAAFGISYMLYNYNDKFSIREFLRKPLCICLSIPIIVVIAFCYLHTEAKIFDKTSPVYTFFEQFNPFILSNYIYLAMFLCCILLYVLLMRVSIGRKALIFIIMSIVIFDGFIYSNNVYELFYGNAPEKALTMKNDTVKHITEINKNNDRVVSFGRTSIGIAANTNIIYSIYNVNGYLPQCLKDYTKLFQEPDYMQQMTNLDLLKQSSQALDIANGRFLVIARDIDEKPINIIEGIPFRGVNTINLAKNDEITLDIKNDANSIVDTLGIISMLGNSVEIANDEVICTAIIYDNTGNKIELNIKAGTDTSEYAYDRADVLESIKHERAKIAGDIPSDGFVGHAYISKINIGTKFVPKKITFKYVNEHGSIYIERMSLFNNENGECLGTSVINTEDGLYKKIYTDKDNVIYENLNAMPRAWVVSSITSVEKTEDIYNCINTGKIGTNIFDPSKTVLIQSNDVEKYSLESYNNSEHGIIRFIQKGYNNINLESSYKNDIFVIISDTFYPGWKAYANGNELPIIKSDGIFKGILIPGGVESVELRYIPTFFIPGLVLTLFGLAVCTLLIFYNKRLSTWLCK